MPFYGLRSGQDTAEDSVSELGNMSIDTFKTEKQREKEQKLK